MKFRVLPRKQKNKGGKQDEWSRASSRTGDKDAKLDQKSNTECGNWFGEPQWKKSALSQDSQGRGLVLSGWGR